MNIISGSTHLRFNSRLNHACYARLHGYGYVFDSTPRPLASVYDHKLQAILDLPIDDEWWFWIDDDAFFTQFPRPVEEIGLAFDDNLFIFPKSPVNPDGGWTYLSSGNFFFRNCAQVHGFLAAALDSDLAAIRQWWDASRLGMFTNGDQDKIVWRLLQEDAVSSRTGLVPYELFNTRPYHFKDSPTEHFLVHFAVPGQTKESAVQGFQGRFGFADNSLVPVAYAAAADQLRHFAVSGPAAARPWWKRLRARG